MYNWINKKSFILHFAARRINNRALFIGKLCPPTPPFMPSITGERTVALTVGKIESGTAVVVTDELQMLELPASILPTVSVGSIVRMQVNSAMDLQMQRRAEFTALQNSILRDYGSAPDASIIKECLRLSSQTHTTLTVVWPEWSQLCGQSNATLHALDGLLNERRLPTTLRPGETTLRLTGLEPARSYTIKLIFRTSAGRYETGELCVQTAALDDFSCLRVTIDDGVEPMVIDSLKVLGAQILEKFEADQSTHIVTGRNLEQLDSGPDDGELARMARHCNIPIVTKEWVNACKAAGRMQSVSQFYCQ